MTYLMLCKHKKTKQKMISWAFTVGKKHIQGFSFGKCCVKCGKEVEDSKRTSV